MSVRELALVLQDDNPLLREVSDPVPPGYDTRSLISALEATLEAYGGRGLSAIQIGVPKRVLIIREGTKQKPDYLAMINPVVHRVLNRHVVEQEGCLSIKGGKRYLPVSRPAKCDVSWLTIDGQEQSATLTGDTARIFQHEFDHLNGVLMTDRFVEGAARI